MPLTLQLPSLLSNRLGKTELLVEANCPEELARKVVADHPEIKTYIFNSQDRMRDSLLFYIGGKILQSKESIPDGWRWCINPIRDKPGLLLAFLSDALRDWHPELRHPVD